MLNEWRQFLNENEGDDYYVRKMTPAGDLEYFEMIMDNGDSYIAEYDPSSEEVRVYMHHDAGEDLAAKALRYIQQDAERFRQEDAPYDQERFPEDGEKDLDPEKISQARLDGATDYREGGSMERAGKWEGGPYFEEYKDAYYTAREEEDRQDYYRDLEDEE